MAERHMGEFNVQDLANTAWAFAKASQADARLFMAVARTAERRVREFDVLDLTNNAWALADSAACTLGSCRSGALGR